MSAFRSILLARANSMSRSCFAAIFLPLMVSLGCGDSSRVAAPEFDAVAIATGAISAYDGNSDGEISKAEAKKSPFAIDRWDEDSSGGISEDEIQARIGKYMEKKTGMLDVTCRVTVNGRPLDGATVEFVPEDFMGGAIQTAEATTDIDGMAMPAIPEIVAKDPVLTGVQPGLYRIQVTHSDIKLPAKYNDSTTLTFDASPLDVVFEAVELKLRK